MNRLRACCVAHEPVGCWVRPRKCTRRVVLDAEEHVNAPEQDSVNVQEVDGENALGLGGEELPPGRSGSSGCWWQTGAEQDGAHSAGGQAVSQA